MNGRSGNRSWICCLSNADEPFSLEYLSELVPVHVETAKIVKRARVISPSHHGDLECAKAAPIRTHPADAQACRPEDPLRFSPENAPMNDSSRDAAELLDDSEAEEDGEPV